MALKLKDIFPGKGMGRREIEGDALINHIAIIIQERSVVRMAWARYIPEESKCQRGARRPDMRTTPTPPRPGGVASAAMVS